jgi:hypothetical protein
MPQLARALLAASAIVAAACQSVSSPTPTDALVDDRAPTRVVHENYSGFSEAARFVVRNLSQWASVWATVFAGRSELPPRPAIDFSREMVIVAAQGAQPSSGYDIAIDRVGLAAGSIAVDVTTTSPDRDCMLLAVITSPVMMVRVPLSASPVRFVEHTRTRSCE